MKLVINKLSDLMQKGAITQDEFDEQKRKIPLQTNFKIGRGP